MCRTKTVCLEIYQNIRIVRRLSGSYLVYRVHVEGAYKKRLLYDTVSCQ